jgi:RluA family pseudouridine synthase
MNTDHLESIFVDPEFSGLPLDDYLAVRWPDRSKEGIRALFARGAVRSKGLPVSPSARAGGFADLSLHADPAGLPAIHLAPEELRSGVRIIHEDRRITVLEKPSGVPVIPDRDRRGPSCLGFLIAREMAARAGAPPADWSRPRVAHRIDRLTSGVVVMARSLAAEVLLSEMFQAGEVRKDYLALLTGVVEPARITVNIPIAPGRKGKMRAAAGGKPSITVFDVLERFPGFTLVRASPRTGRTHQIRVHAWAIGHPLAVDPLYRVGAAAALPGPPGIERLTLHAERIVLPERWGEGPREFVAEMPADFQAAIATLRSRQ